MFQIFLRARALSFIWARLGDDGFRARSADRDYETDEARIGSIVTAIDAALYEAEFEQSGLSRRVDDVLARAAVTLGNGTDEYLDRDALDSYHQDLITIEISNGQRRLKELEAAIAQFRSIKAALLSSFPNYKASATRN